MYGLGAGLFFIGYALCEVPSNLLLLRFGAKRWLARIMFTWGLLAAAMMFVRTPLEFNVLRFLLGMAEAGFFPGVLYYLTLWFPAQMRARAVSRFYIALPLGSVVMGVGGGMAAGLGRQARPGRLAVAVSAGGIAVGAVQPGDSEDAAGRSGESGVADGGREGVAGAATEADGEKAHLGHGAGVMQALLVAQGVDDRGYFFFALITSYAYSFSAPAILQGATGWSVTHVGYLVACFGLAGAAGMLLNGAHSDRTRREALHCVVPCVVMAAGYLTASYAKERG